MDIVTKILFYFFVLREDGEDIDTDLTAEEAPERNSISKLGKSKSEEMDFSTGDRSATSSTGKSAAVRVTNAAFVT